jgi:hypothetical protein
MEGFVQINRRNFTALGTLFAVIALSTSLHAAGLGNPVESPILVVAGQITVTNKGARAVLDRPMLEAMGSHEFKTSTPWYTGQMLFEGVLFSKLVKELGATGENLVITALDDYSREIPIEDLVKNGAILAWKRNGEYLPVSDKGPLFVVYPYDSNPELKNEKYYSRSVWQVRRIEVR